MSFQLNAVLQQVESIDHFDALKRCLLSCDLSRDISDMTTEQNKQRRGLSSSKLKGHQYLVQLADVQIHPTYVLCKALMNPSCQQIYLLGDHTVLEQLLSEFTARTGITIDRFTVEPIQEKSQIIDFRVLELNKLFWKKKSEHLAQACKYIAQDNASLIGLQLGIDEHYAAHLIDDLLYGEHVFGEFTETILKHHLEMSRQAEQVA